MFISSGRLGRATCGRRWRWWQFQNWVSTTSFRHVLWTSLRVISKNCKWSIISVFGCQRPCTVLSMLQEDGTTVLRLIFETLKGEESVMEPCLWTFRDENGVIHALCLVYVDDFMLACSDSPFGKHVFDNINNLYEWWKWESRVFTQCGAQITQPYNKHTGTWVDLRSVSQNAMKRFRPSLCHHIDAETRNPKSHHLSFLNFEPWMVSCFGWVCNVCHNCWHLCRCWWDKHLKPRWARFMRWTSLLGRRLRGQGHHSKSMLIILLFWLRTQMLDGPLDQMAPHKVDSWSSLQTPSCCKAESQTCLWYPGIRVDWDGWQDLHLQQRLKQRQTAMMMLSTCVCAWKKFCSDSWICETGSLKRDKFLLLWCWTVVVSAVPWLALRLLVLDWKTRNLAWRHLRSDRVSSSVEQ